MKVSELLEFLKILDPDSIILFSKDEVFPESPEDKSIVPAAFFDTGEWDSETGKFNSFSKNINAICFWPVDQEN